jgi:hypothetical protein
MKRRTAGDHRPPLDPQRESEMREARIAAVDERGCVWVKVPGSKRAAQARIARALRVAEPDPMRWPGRAVLVVRTKESPVVVDFIEDGISARAGTDTREVVIDGQRLVLEGKEQITLRCGKATITLTRAGKILIRGAYLSSRSSGVNRVLGGSVQIN